jgi:hypothetical protein
MTGHHQKLPLQEEIKRSARVFKKTLSLGHTRALDKASVENGFQNYQHAYKAGFVAPSAPKKSKGVPPRFEISVSMYWKDKKLSLHGRETLQIFLTKPLSEITTLANFKLLRGLANSTKLGESSFQRDFVTHNQADARNELYLASRTLAFMDATGLQPSSGWTRAYPRGQTKIPGEDHARIWFDPKTRRYLICDEPYQWEFNEAMELRFEWLTKHGYAMQTPTWLGTYNPYMDATNGSRLHLITHATKGVNLEPLIHKLNLLPPPIGNEPWAGISAPPTMLIPR